MSVTLSEVEEKQVEVFKHNRLVDGRAKFSINALRVFALAVTRLKPGSREHPGSRIVSFTASEYGELLESSSNGLHADLKTAASELVHAKVSIPLDDHRQKRTKRRGWLEASLVAAAQLSPGTGIFQMEFAELLAPYLFDLKKNFCTYDIQHAMKLTSKYAFRLFELVKSWQGNVDDTGKPKPFVVRLDDLREMLGIVKLEKYSHFRARVLDDSIEQMEKHTDVSFSYREIKEGRAVVALELTLIPKPPQQPPTPAPASEPASSSPQPTLFGLAASALAAMAESPGQTAPAAAKATSGVPVSADPVAAAEARVKSRRFMLDAARAADPADPAIVAECEADLNAAALHLASLKAAT